MEFDLLPLKPTYCVISFQNKDHIFFPGRSLQGFHVRDYSQNAFDNKEHMGEENEVDEIDVSADISENLEFNSSHHQGPFAHHQPEGIYTDLSFRPP